MGEKKTQIQALVTQLESHLNQNETNLKKILKIHQESTDLELDDLFLQNEFSSDKLLSQTQILRPITQNEIESLETKCLSEATKRLKSYLDMLKDQIIRIVEAESDEFIQVSSKLEGFNLVLSDLKESIKDFHHIFSQEKQQTYSIFTYLSQQHKELVQLIKEKEELEYFVNLQYEYNNLNKKLQENTNEYLALEEMCLLYSDIKQKSKDTQMSQNIVVIQRTLLTKLNNSLKTFINTSKIFGIDQINDEEEYYFSECELASYLRAFKLLNLEQSFYESLSNLVLRPQINKLMKKAYDSKQNALDIMRGNNNIENLPLSIYFQGILSEILNGSLRYLLNITTNENEYNFVDGYQILKGTLWSLIIQCLDQSLSFVYSTGNLKVFQKNYMITLIFINAIKQYDYSQQFIKDLKEKFNLQTYLNVLIIEQIDKFVAELEKNFESSNDQVKSISEITLNYVKNILNDEYYIAEIGDKLLKLSIQFIIRHINFINEKINEKKSMGMERILLILEDLNFLQAKLYSDLQPLMINKIYEIQKEFNNKINKEDIKAKFVQPLLLELNNRFEIIIEPCINTISQKIYQKLNENLQAFQQVAQMYRMTNREIENTPSPFMQNILKPLQSLKEQKYFFSLTQGIRVKLFENVLKKSFSDLKDLIDKIVKEEQKMHESLKKYKKEVEGKKNLSDFDKMKIQLYIDMRDLEQQIEVIIGGKEFYNRQKFHKSLDQIYDIIQDGEVEYKRLFND